MQFEGSITDYCYCSLIMFNANERNPRRESGTCRNAAVGQRTYRSKDWKTIMQHFQLEAHNFNSDNVMSFLNNLIM